MQLFKQWLHDRCATVVLPIFAAFLFTVIFTLNGLTSSWTIYGWILTLVGLAVWGSLNFSRFRTRHNRIVGALPNVPTAPLPEPHTQTELDDAAYIEALRAVLRAQNIESKRREQETIDYFTLWAHQIKTPIAGMRLLLEEEDAPELREELFRIQTYTDMALQYLRLESSTTDYRFESADLDELIRAELRRFAPMFIRRKLSLDYTPVNTQVITDKKWLAFVLGQVLSNAVKYTSTGGVSIYLQQEDAAVWVHDSGNAVGNGPANATVGAVKPSLPADHDPNIDVPDTPQYRCGDKGSLDTPSRRLPEYDSPDTPSYRLGEYDSPDTPPHILSEYGAHTKPVKSQPPVLVIEDTGTGILPEDLPRIFERGFTGYNGRIDKKASGLGLFLCRKVLDGLGHDITITSVPGHGTQVRLNLSRRSTQYE